MGNRPKHQRAVWYNHLDKEITVWNIQTKKILATFKHTGSRIDQLAIDDERDVFYAAIPEDGALVTCSIADGAVSKTIDTFAAESAPHLLLSPNDQYLRFGSKIIDVRSNTLVGTTAPWNAVVAAFSEDSRFFLGSTSTDYAVRVFDIARKETVAVHKGHTHRIVDIACTTGGRLVIAAGLDGTVRIWNGETGRVLTALQSEGEWLMFDDEGNFAGTRRGGRLAAVRAGTRALAIDQFALTRNRPHQLLAALGSPHTALTEHYAATYLRRLRKAGLKPEDVNTGGHRPVVRIDATPTDGELLGLACSFTDDQYDLSTCNIWVNDVPEFGMAGLEIMGRSHTSKDYIFLEYGRNKIEVGARNALGADSYRAVAYVDGPQAKPSCLYYVGLGVSTYKDPNLNLAFAHKDAQDLERAFSAMADSNLFSAVKTRVYTDEQVNRDAIADAKGFLEGSQRQDVLVLFIAGHGVYEYKDVSTYYYLSHEADVDRLSDTALPFELIEDLLQSVRPRRKVFLMDTCESGEVDETQASGCVALVGTRGIRPRAARGITVKKMSSGGGSMRWSLQDQNRYIYNDLYRRSGTIVFSSCGGGEYSYESDEAQNGLFTEAIMEGLRGKAAAEAGWVDVMDLRAYVSKTVPERSEGAQHPTVDRDNIHTKLGFPVVASPQE